MPSGQRYSPENPSPTYADLAEFIKGKGYDITPSQVQSVFTYHKEWQRGHAEKTRANRSVLAEQKEAEKAQKAKEREEKKAERERVKAEKEAEKERKKAEREQAKAEKEAAKQLDGDDSTSAPNEAAAPRRRLRTKDAEPAAAGQF